MNTCVQHLLHIKSQEKDGGQTSEPSRQHEGDEPDMTGETKVSLLFGFLVTVLVELPQVLDPVLPQLHLLTLEHCHALVHYMA